MDLLWFFISAWFALFATVDPLGNVPFYVSLTEDLPWSSRLRIIKKAISLATCILMGFALFGNMVFDLFGISISAFKIAGGLLLLRIAFSMMQGERPKTKQTKKEKTYILEKFLTSDKPSSEFMEELENGGIDTKEDGLSEEERFEAESVGIVPLGIPLFAGPGGITTVIIFASEPPAGMGGGVALILVLAAILAIMVFSFATLFYADPIFQRLGKTGTLVLSRLFGLILAAIAVQLVIAGVSGAATDWYISVVGLLGV